MGSGINAAKELSPEAAQAMENFRDQLMIVLLQRLGDKVSIPVAEVDNTGGHLVTMKVENGVFNIEVIKKH